MRSRIITTVVGILLIGPFALYGYHDAVSIKQHLQEQHQHVQKLQTESAKLDSKLAQTQATKAQSQQEIDQLQQQTEDANAQRLKLEAELAGN